MRAESAWIAGCYTTAFDWIYYIWDQHKGESGRTCTPQAFSILSIGPRIPEKTEESRQPGRETLREMLGMEGFIESTTFTTWKQSEHISQMGNSISNDEALRRCLSKDLAQSGIVNPWQSVLMVRSNQRYPQCQFTLTYLEQNNVRSIYLGCTATNASNSSESSYGLCIQGCGPYTCI